MKKCFLWLILTTLFQVHSSEWSHRDLSETEKKQDLFVWEKTELAPFNELIVSWDAKRPVQGSYLIQVSLFVTEWSPWLDYAYWGVEDQHTFKERLPEAKTQVYQDAAEILEGHQASGFKVRVIAQKMSSLEKFDTLHACATDWSTHAVSLTVSEGISIDLNVLGLSQIALPDERRLRLCSPTSTTAVIRFLLNDATLSPLVFADKIFDTAFDIYGNWNLNTAQASHELGKPWHCFVARLTSFNQIIDQLSKGHPVIVSVKDPLKGSAIPYKSGHLLVVKGYDATKQEVLCMDPAFPTDQLTHVAYALSDFLAAWSRRGGIAYIFDQ